MQDVKTYNKMFDYRDTQNRLFARGIRFDEKQYMFVAMVAAGEDPSVAYGLVYDIDNFKRNVPSESEEDYLTPIRKRADMMLEQRECVQLREIIEESIRAEVQSRATNIKEYKFSSQEIVNMLSTLLADRSDNISDASIRDIVTLIRELASLGGLSGSDGFQNHFIQVLPHFNALCPQCNHEFDCFPGVNCVCPHCHQTFLWEESEKRFYPAPSKL